MATGESPPPDGWKCARCSQPILPTDRVLFTHGDWFHERCDLVVRSGEASATSRQRVKTSHASIARSLLRMEAAAVRCVVCGTGIKKPADLALDKGQPVHVRCRQ